MSAAVPLKLPALSVTENTGSSYPEPFRTPCLPRASRRLADAFGLSQFGVNMVRLPPGAWSSQRHWHAKEDEFVYMLEGEAVLATDEGETVMRPGDCAGFPAGVRNGHHLKNESAADAVFLVVGTRIEDDHGEYPDIDMRFENIPGGGGRGRFTRKDGTPY
ncbi:MAG: cupin domain-containing protein [Maricaulaceae bacterium]|nr:cupin domain-containing protein [Maricaulaceae bacterium]